MPVVTINRPNTDSTAPWADAAKQFLKSPGFANDYMDNADGAMEKSVVPQERPYTGDAAGMDDRSLLAGILSAEGTNPEDYGYIANVIQNRVASGQHPNDLRGVIMAPGQFSALNAETGYAGGEGANDHWRRPTGEAMSIADAIIAGQWQDQTSGALNYYNPNIASPDWGGDGFRGLPGSQHIFGTAG
jgi:spore germination cell wall hydrolase CwlJ-like protein